MRAEHRFFAALILAMPLVLVLSAPAEAGWTVCNRTSDKIGVMIAMAKENSKTESRGPSYVEAGQCQEILHDALNDDNIYDYVAQQMDGPSPLYWSGGPGGHDWYCVDESGNQFDYFQEEAGACPGSGVRVSFRTKPEGAPNYTLDLTASSADPRDAHR